MGQTCSQQAGNEQGASQQEATHSYLLTSTASEKLFCRLLGVPSSSLQSTGSCPSSHLSTGPVCPVCKGKHWHQPVSGITRMQWARQRGRHSL